MHRDMSSDNHKDFKIDIVHEGIKPTAVKHGRRLHRFAAMLDNSKRLCRLKGRSLRPGVDSTDAA